MTTDLEPRRITEDLEPDRTPGLTEIAVRILCAVAPAVWRSGSDMPMSELARKSIDLAAMVLGGREREVAHRRLGFAIGTMVITEEGGFWGRLDPRLTGGTKGTTGPHSSPALCVAELERLYEANAK